MSKPADNQRKALGRGLGALLANRTTPKPDPLAAAAAAAPAPEAAPAPAGLLHVSIDSVDANPLQPRSIFQQERLQELAESIKANGIIQPLVVRARDGRYELVAGERRLRAARLAGIEQVPIVVQDITDDHLLEIALIENIQREDLNAIEVARAFERLAVGLNLSHDQIAQRTGKDRTTVTNTLRLLKLPRDVQQLVADRSLSMGHARAILGLPTEELQQQLAQKAAAQGLSVRQVEQLVQKIATPAEPKPAEEVDPNVKAAIQELERVLGTRVRIAGNPAHRGRIEIEYYSGDDLHRIYSAIVGDSN
jgi:ParB family chromosome partitioning protein